MASAISASPREGVLDVVALQVDRMEERDERTGEAAGRGYVVS